MIACRVAPRWRIMILTREELRAQLLEQQPGECNHKQLCGYTQGQVAMITGQSLPQMISQ